MKHRVKVVSISPCGCGYEGTVRLLLQACGEEIDCSYIGRNDATIAAHLPIGNEKEVQIIRAFSKISPTSSRTEAIGPRLIGRLNGRQTIDGDEFVVVDVGFPVAVDDELGGDEGLATGDWVECSGEFRVHI